MIFLLFFSLLSIPITGMQQPQSQDQTSESFQIVAISEASQKNSPTQTKKCIVKKLCFISCALAALCTGGFAFPSFSTSTPIIAQSSCIGNQTPLSNCCWDIQVYNCGQCLGSVQSYLGCSQPLLAQELYEQTSKKIARICPSSKICVNLFDPSDVKVHKSRQKIMEQLEKDLQYCKEES